LLTYLLLTYLFTAGVSRIPTLCRADDELDTLSDTGTYDVDDDESVAVVEARRQIDKAFGVLSNVFSVTSVASNGPIETQVNRAVFAGNHIRSITGLYEDKHRYKTITRGMFWVLKPQICINILSRYRTSYSRRIM